MPFDGVETCASLDFCVVCEILDSTNDFAVQYVPRTLPTAIHAFGCPHAPAARFRVFPQWAFRYRLISDIDMMQTALPACRASCTCFPTFGGNFSISLSLDDLTSPMQ